MWLEIPPAQRRSISVTELTEKMQTATKKEAAMYEMKLSTLHNLKRKLESSKEHDLRFVRIEAEGADGMGLVALALYEVHGPATKDSPPTSTRP